MKRIFFIMLLFFFFCARPADAQDQNQGSGYRVQGTEKEEGDTHEVNPGNASKLPPGMELKKIGGINMVVPQGTQFYTEGAQLKMEEAGEYSARRFKETDDRFRKIEEKQDKLEAEVKELRALVNKK